jgi:hypothetical protein
VVGSWLSARGGPGGTQPQDRILLIELDCCVLRGDMAVRIFARPGHPAIEPVEKPAPPTDCTSQFGNSDADLSTITP